MIIATIVFGVSLLGIGALFGVKYVEEKRGIVLASHARGQLDTQALRFKSFLAALRVDLAKLPPLAVVMVRLGIRELALGFAALARFLEGQAHRLADLVSHKHRFERRETQSEFLKKVSESGNRSGDSGNDSTAV